MDCKPGNFQMAIEEAFLAEQGFTEKLIQDINLAAGNATYDESVFRWLQEATGSNQDQDGHSPTLASFLIITLSIYCSLNFLTLKILRKLSSSPYSKRVPES